MILDGKKLKERRLLELKQKVSNLNKKLSLVVIQVGDDEASNIYVNQKKKMCEYVGYNFIHSKLDINITEKELLNIIDRYNKDNAITGILVQLPLPKHINPVLIQNKIQYNKDVDGMSDINMGRLVHNRECLVSCTPKGIVNLLNDYNINISGKHIVIIGRSNLVGKPLFHLLLNNDATITITHSKTNNLSSITNKADILIVAVGKKHLITADMVKDGAIVVDVGINRENNKLYGDVDFDNVSKKASYITPVPGGIGPMTVCELAYNIYDANFLGSDKYE